MVPKLKNQNRVVMTPPNQTPATLRDVLDQEPDPRRRSALRRLETFLAAPLESLPADIGWFDAQFPRDGFGRTDTIWASFRAYRNWQSAVRGAIRRHVLGLGTTIMQVRHVQARHLSVPEAHRHSPTPADQIFRTDVDRVVARYANFRKTASGPKSD